MLLLFPTIIISKTVKIKHNIYCMKKQNKTKPIFAFMPEQKRRINMMSHKLSQNFIIFFVAVCFLIPCNSKAVPIPESISKLSSTIHSTESHDLYFYPLAAILYGEIGTIDQQILLEDYTCESSCGSTGWTNNQPSFDAACFNAKDVTDEACYQVTWTGPFDGCDRTCQINTDPTQWTYFSQQVTVSYGLAGNSTASLAQVQKFLSTHNITGNWDLQQYDEFQVSTDVGTVCKATIGMGYVNGVHNSVVENSGPYSDPDMGQQCSYCETVSGSAHIYAGDVDIPLTLDIQGENKVAFFFCKEDVYNFQLKVTCPDIFGNCNLVTTIVDLMSWLYHEI